VLGS
jgi:hypothetical protein